VERAVQRTGYADFWELRRRSALPRETMNYVPAILAMAIVTKNLTFYGLPAPEFEPSLDYENLTVTSPTSLALIADGADVSPSVIREMNPAILRGVAPAGFDVHVPREKRSAILAALDAVPEANRASWRLHRVSNGETLASIARQYATGANQIVAANARLDESFFQSPSDGELLLIPAKAAPAPIQKATSGKKSGARKYRASSTRKATPKPGARVVAARKPAPKTTARR
jgi:membrane-bound lytic murein transglycosylase D